MKDNSSSVSAASSPAAQPQDWIVGVIDTPADAEQAAQDLHNAGFADEEVLLSHGPDAEQAFQDQAAHQGLLKRIMSLLVGDANESSSFADDYTEEAKLGHSIISVYVPQNEDIAQAQQILEAHGGHRIKHYGQWVTTHLSSQERDQHEPRAAVGLQAAADANQPTQQDMGADQRMRQGMAADQPMAPRAPGATNPSPMPNTTGAQTGMAEPSSTQAHMTSQPNTTNTTNPQTTLPNTVESASGWQVMPPIADDQTDTNQYPGEGI